MMILGIVAGNPCTPSMIRQELLKLEIHYDLASCSRNMQLMEEEGLLHCYESGHRKFYSLSKLGYETLLSRINLLQQFLLTVSFRINHLDMLDLK